MNHRKVIFWSVSVALGGFLFGLDTAVISGCEKTIQKLWGLSDTLIGQVVASALYGTIVGAIFGGLPAQAYGRKPTLFWIAILYLISAIGAALAPDAVWLSIFRFVGGLSIGASSVVAPMYISEIAPAEKRGQLTALFQFNIVFGILVAYFSNWLIGSGLGDEGWRWMLGIVAFPSALFVALMMVVPESPRWLILKKGDLASARGVFAQINPLTVEQSVEAVRASTAGETSGGSLGEFFSGRYRKPILWAFLFALFNQVSGINAVIYYAPRIFEDAGLAANSALLSSVGIGLVNLVFTMLGLVWIDRYGRRFLMYIGSVGYIVSLGLVSWAFATGASGMLVPVLLFAFIAAHAIGQGAVIWVFVSEIFPNAVRSWGNSLGSTTHWIFAALIAGNFPLLASTFGQAKIFGLFAVLMVFQLLFVWKMMPETKGVPLEEIEKRY